MTGIGATPAASGARKLSTLSVTASPAQATSLRLVVVHQDEELPSSVKELIDSQKVDPRLIPYESVYEAGRLSGADAVLFCNWHQHRLSTTESRLLADALVQHRLTGIVLSPDTSGVVPDDEIAFMPVRQDVSAEELWGRVATIRQYRPLLAQMEAQVTGMQRLGKRLNQQFVEVDQELRLASRLQRDFLPRRLPEVGDLKFTAFYRPASWVSGDVYDVQRLDENHLGFYLADAVGHGVAAGLLTVFIKQAMIGKRITRERYEIVPPSEVLETLNSQLTEQELPNCQFVTAAYAVIHAETHELTYARGGHPHPIRIAPDGTCAESRTPGGLLGVFPNETYPSTKLVLGPGEKFVIYSDGLEDHILERIGRDQRKLAFTESFQAMARLDIDGFMQAFTEQLDQSEGSLAPHDDMTMVVVERKA